MKDYSEAVGIAAESIVLMGRHMSVHGYAVVLIAGIIGDIYEVETREVVKDIDRAANGLRAEQADYDV